MSKLIRKWVKECPRTWKPQLEEWQHDDGSIHYCFRGWAGKPSNIASWEEAEKLINEWELIRAI